MTSKPFLAFLRRHAEKLAFAVASCGLLLSLACLRRDRTGDDLEQSVRSLRRESEQVHDDGVRRASQYARVDFPSDIYSAAPGSDWAFTRLPAVKLIPVEGPTKPVSPLPVVGLKSAKPDPDGVTLEWNLQAAGNPVPVERIAVERRKPGSRAWQSIAALEPDRISYRDSATTRHRSYDYRIRIVAQDGRSAVSSTLSATLPGIWTLTILTANKTGVFMKVEKNDPLAGKSVGNRLFKVGDIIEGTLFRLETCAENTVRIPRLRCDKGPEFPHEPIVDRQPCSGTDIVYTDPDDGRRVAIRRPDPAANPAYADQLCLEHAAEKLFKEAAACEKSGLKSEALVNYRKLLSNFKSSAFVKSRLKEIQTKIQEGAADKE